MPGTLVLTASDVAALLRTEDCIEAVERAFGLWADGEIGSPHVLGVHVANGGFHIKAAVLPHGGRRYFAAKTNGNFPGNPEHRGLPSIQGVIVLADADDGRPLAVMDSITVTELRTAAATAVAARYLSRPDSERVTLIGCGAQAPAQLRALAAVRPVSHVRLIDRDPARAELLATRMASELGIRVEADLELASAVASSDICVTCTTAKHPILMADMVGTGLFIAAVGADNPDKHELDVDLLRRAKIVVDSLDQAAAIGDLHHAILTGAVRREDVHAELGEVVVGRADGRTDDEEVIVFDSTGTALQDVAAAAIVYERARSAGRGLELDLAG